MLGNPHISDAALMLSDLIDQTAATPRWSPLAVITFTDSLEALNRHPDDELSMKMIAYLETLALRVSGAASAALR
jgi:hypothetical protein